MNPAQKSQAAESAILEATFVALLRSMTDEQLLLFCRKAKSLLEAARLDALDRQAQKKTAETK